MRLPFGGILGRTFGFAADRARASRRGALLWILVVAVEKQLPLIPVLEAYAQDAGPKWGSYALRLVAALRSGLSVPDALRNVPGAVPQNAVLAAQIGAETGTLGPALRAAAESHSRRQDATIPTLHGFLGYVIALVGIGLTVTMFIMYWIIPKFKKIFDDFETELPYLTRLLLSAVDTLINYFYLVPLLALVIAVAGYVLYQANRADSDRVVWLGQWFPSRWFPDIERSLAVVVDAGRPIDSALATLVAHHPSEAIRTVMNQVQREVNAGNPLWGSLAEKGIIRRADASVLVAAERAGNLPWALRSVADNTERNVIYRTRVWYEFLQPAFVVVVGAIVGTIVLAYFMPLLKLIGDLA